MLSARVAPKLAPSDLGRRSCSINELRQEFEIFHVGEDAIVRHEGNLKPAVAATQWSASCSGFVCLAGRVGFPFGFG
jgi:hypothetical protein